MVEFIGWRSEVAVCTSSYCNNNGLCSIENHNGIEKLQYKCYDGFKGLKCETDFSALIVWTDSVILEVVSVMMAM